MENTSYENFLKMKQKAAKSCGFLPKGDFQKLFDWQKAVERWICRTGRAALFLDCGLGKSPLQLFWAREVSNYTGNPVLILAPLAVSQQTIREGVKFGIPVNLVESAADVKPGINITNYEKLYKFDTSAFSGVVLDESGILKSFTGKTKRHIISAFTDTPFKLCATATPAPNDLMELLNHAEFLGVMKSNEALACWFIADQTNSGHYRLKGHAKKDFWRWVSSWAVCISKPSDIGFSDNGYILPPLHEIDEILSSKIESGIEEVARHVKLSATGFHAEKRRTLKKRCARCAEIANETEEQVLVWCYQNDESTELKRLIPEAIEIKGSDNSKVKEEAAINFATGTVRVLISKPSIFGYGLNFQNCHTAIFCGMDYSFESYYQALRRLYRFGQEHPVTVYRVLSDTERHILDVINTKALLKQDMEISMSEAVKEFQSGEIYGKRYTLKLDPQIAKIPSWLKEVI